MSARRSEPATAFAMTRRFDAPCTQVFDAFVDPSLFEERGGKTTLSLTSSPLDASEAECATFDEGRASMVGGWSGSFDQLDAYLMETLR